MANVFDQLIAVDLLGLKKKLGLVMLHVALKVMREDSATPKNAERVLLATDVLYHQQKFIDMMAAAIIVDNYDTEDWEAVSAPDLITMVEGVWDEFACNRRV